jgi:hypothetical protein
MNSKCLNARSAENSLAVADAGTIEGEIKSLSAKADTRKRKIEVSNTSVTEIDEGDEVIDIPDLTEPTLSFADERRMKLEQIICPASYQSEP